MEQQASRQAIDAFVESHQEHFIAALARLVAQPSVSARGEGVQACAELVAEIMAEHGYPAEIIPSGGNPVVYAEGDGASEKTILFYCHYDVQPPEPLELWHSPPFELTRRDGRLVGRGASDDKGHLVARLAGLAAVKNALGGLPCRVKFLIEGEEELGSPHIPAFVQQHQARLAADGCVWEFGGVDHSGAPVQSLGLRGILYVELVARTASQDTHSGLGGSIFPNAAWRLAWALNALKGPDERIRIPGFYADARPPSQRDLELLAALPDDAEAVRQMYGLKGYLKGMTGGLEWQRAAVFEPTCTICGLDAGYQGPGSKTVLPAEARAKIDFRLVPDQEPDDILGKLRAHLDSAGFDDIEILRHGGTRPARTDPDDPFVRLTVATAYAVYGREMVVSPLSGGSGPNYPFIHTLKLPVVAMGVSHPGANIHAPNENIRLEDFLNGIRHTAYLVEAFGRQATGA